MADPLSVRSWTRLTVLGWLLGIVLVITLALMSESVGIRAAQIPVGLGMGLGVGIMQERALRPRLNDPHSWRSASALGLTLPFLAVDLSRLLGAPLPYSLYAAVTMAGATAGVCQARLLRPLAIGALRWILTSALGWTLGAAMLAAADSVGTATGLYGLEGALLYVALLAMGGVLLGLVTSLPLRRLA